MTRHRSLCTWLALPLFALPAAAAVGDEPAAHTLSPVTVLGTRTERPSDAIPHSVDVVDQGQIAAEQSSDLGEAIETLPNVSLTGSPRPTGEQIQIRGLSGNRVLILIDGVPQNLNEGHLSNTFIEPDIIQQIEVERGPASVLWGSGALGGVISVRTKDAVDLLEPDQAIGARVRGGYQSATDGWLGSAAVYGTYHDRVDGLLYVDRQDNDDLKLGNGETLDHSAYRRDTLLAKATFYPTDAQSLGLSHRRLHLEGDEPSNPADTISIENPLLSREIALESTQVEWRLMPGSPSVDLHTRLYHNKIEVDEDSDSLDRRDHTKVNTLGLNLSNTTRFNLGAAGNHALSYGVDGYRDHAEATRNGAPRPAFPDAKRLTGGAFIQDEIGWGERWTTTLGLRYDRYHSESEDAVAPSQNADKLSTQFGIVWQTTDWLSVYASYAEAFRAPTLTELYATGTHFGGNHFVPNPNLKPEQAANKELGLRTGWNGLFATDDRLSFNVSVFRNDVEDFIDTIATVKPLPFPPFVGGTTRSENVRDARLQGFEANARYVTPAWFISLGYGQTRGENKTDNQPLADIAPDRWVMQLGFTQLPWDGRITLRTTLAERQDRVPAGVEETAGYAVYDLFTTWRPSHNLRLDLGVGNLTDKAYRQHNAVIAEAGRNVKASLTLKF